MILMRMMTMIVHEEEEFIDDVMDRPAGDMNMTV